MDDAAVQDVLQRAVEAVQTSLIGHTDWGLSGLRDTQYNHDLVADAAALEVLHDAGFAVVSEESGRSGPDNADITVICDPIDGSTNASHAIPWWAASFAAIDSRGLVASVVANLPLREVFAAVRGEGATCNGAPISVSPRTSFVDGGICGVVGWPAQRIGTSQMRALGASALDLCLVGAGRLDAFVDCSVDGNSPWDYMGAALIIREAGGVVVDSAGRDLLTTDPTERRWVVAAGTQQLLDEVLPLRAPANPSSIGGAPR